MPKKIFLSADEYIQRRRRKKFRNHLNGSVKQSETSFPKRRKESPFRYRLIGYWIGHNLLPFAANRNHIGLYPGPEAVKHFAPQLEKAGYPYSKGTIKISDTEPLPLKRIAEIARWCYRREKNA